MQSRDKGRRRPHSSSRRQMRAGPLEKNRVIARQEVLQRRSIPQVIYATVENGHPQPFEVEQFQAKMIFPILQQFGHKSHVAIDDNAKPENLA
jgi:hypothetical protein